MQIILTKDVPKVGRQFDLKNVAGGFALNFLFPKGLAELATKDKIQALAERQAEVAHLHEVSEQALVAAVKKLDGAKITIQGGKANESGSLYKGVSADMVAEALSKAASAKLSADIFDLAHPIKTVGEHPLTLRVPNVSADCTLVVEAE